MCCTLLKGLAGDAGRHLILLTATPHSGDEEALFNLLGLLHPSCREYREQPKRQLLVDAGRPPPGEDP